MDRISKQELVNRIMDDAKQEIYDEEVIHLILEHQVAKKVDERYTFGQKAADKLAGFAGSWVFIIGFSLALIAWITLNVLFLTNPYDPYPFILLNLVLSCIAAIQAPLIMMSQNRTEQKDRRRAENDYKVNLKTEIIIEDLHMKLDLLLRQNELLAEEIRQIKEDKSGE